jgi:hypothetical protein
MTIRSVLFLLVLPITLVADSAFAQDLGSAKVGTPVKKMICHPPQRAGRPSLKSSEPTDLSGVYNLTVQSNGIVPEGTATMTVTGNKFEITRGSLVLRKGRLVATTTGSYTSAAVTFEQPNQTVSVQATLTGSGGFFFSEVCGETTILDWSLEADQSKMYDVHFVTDPTTNPVNIIKELAWQQCKEKDKDIKKCPWRAAGDPEKMLGTYRYFVEWSDGRFKNGQLEVIGNKTFTITAPAPQ